MASFLNVERVHAFSDGFRAALQTYDRRENPFTDDEDEFGNYYAWFAGWKFGCAHREKLAERRRAERLAYIAELAKKELSPVDDFVPF
jgi:hypothetical protein